MESYQLRKGFGWFFKRYWDSRKYNSLPSPKHLMAYSNHDHHTRKLSEETSFIETSLYRS